MQFFGITLHVFMVLVLVVGEVYCLIFLGSRVVWSLLLFLMDKLLMSCDQMVV